MTLIDVLYQAQIIINNSIKREHSAQGHNLTGLSESSLHGEQVRNGSQYVMRGLAVMYMKTLNEGLKPNQISFKVYPNLVNYFLLRGFTEPDAKRIAGATIAKWKQEGMSTEASKRFSSTGERQGFIERGIEKSDVDNYMDSSLDFLVEQQYQKTKSETV